LTIQPHPTYQRTFDLNPDNSVWDERMYEEGFSDELGFSKRKGTPVTPEFVGIYIL
jgi:hypothetical protein